jgi:hypothetical protein
VQKLQKQLKPFERTQRKQPFQKTSVRKEGRRPMNTTSLKLTTDIISEELRYAN